jgi:hypothetical protein
MAESAKNTKKEQAPDLLNEKGELDFAKLLQTNPDLLASFIHPRQEDEDGGSEGGNQSTSMSFAVGAAALRDAMGQSMSYAPLNTAEQVQAMSMSAQANLGLEAAQGLSMDLGRGSATNPFGAADPQPSEPTKKQVKKIKKS